MFLLWCPCGADLAVRWAGPWQRDGLGFAPPHGSCIAVELRRTGGGARPYTTGTTCVALPIPHRAWIDTVSGIVVAEYGGVMVRGIIRVQAGGNRTGTVVVSLEPPCSQFKRWVVFQRPAWPSLGALRSGLC